MNLVLLLNKNLRTTIYKHFDLIRSQMLIWNYKEIVFMVVGLSKSTL